MSLAEYSIVRDQKQSVILQIMGNKLCPKIIFEGTRLTFKTAHTERLKVSGNPSQYDHLDLFIREQDIIRELISRSMLPRLTLDISDNNINTGVERIADWLEVSDGLYMPD